uniref:Transposase Tc1-like domain-containing protein n=1 Tax=Sinocyclocheilus grahami TaxID=75366 RepID=A0A672LFZ7_SINGR
MAPTRELPAEMMEKIIKLLQDGNPTPSVAKEVGCSQSTGRPKKTSKRQDRKLKAICLEYRKCTTKQMKNTWAETGVNVCDRTVRNRLDEVGFTYRKAKRKPALTPKQTRQLRKNAHISQKRFYAHMRWFFRQCEKAFLHLQVTWRIPSAGDSSSGSEAHVLTELINTPASASASSASRDTPVIG